jgi:ectoine hydroxylase-related dioxygenase (phytanoyl-CoA dioxygenase family)
MRLQVSPSEVAADKLDDKTLKTAIEAFYVDGYVVLGGVVDHDGLDQMRQRLDEDTAELLRRIETKGGSDELVGQLSQPMPRSPEHIHRTVVTNPLVIQVTAGLLGEGVHNHFYNCNTNLPGSQAQPLHRDAPHLDHDPANPIISIIVNVSPIGVDETNGATEIWPGTHWIEGLTRISDHVAEKRRIIAPPVRMLSRKGDVVLRDPRLWHRGVPNLGTEIRHMVAMVHSKHFYESDVAIPVTRGALHSFDDEVLTTKVVAVDEDYDYLAESLHL